MRGHKEHPDGSHKDPKVPQITSSIQNVDGSESYGMFSKLRGASLELRNSVRLFQIGRTHINGDMAGSEEVMAVIFPMLEAQGSS